MFSTVLTQQVPKTIKMCKASGLFRWQMMTDIGNEIRNYMYVTIDLMWPLNWHMKGKHHDNL